MVQKHKKIKDVTWWLLLADDKNHLLGVRKVAVSKKLTFKMQFEVPELDKDSQNTKIHCYLLADSYIGFDQKYKLKM